MYIWSVDKFTKAIILADCKLFIAVLTFVRQNVAGYLGNGILQIRRAWKLYDKIQKQLYDIYKKMEPNAEQIYGSDPNSNMIELWFEDDDKINNNEKNSNNSGKNDTNNNETVSDAALKNAISILSCLSNSVICCHFKSFVVTILFFCS